MKERASEAVLDEYLVVRCQLGDPEAFARLVGRWHRKLLRHAYSFTRNGEAAKDVVQESWMAVLRGLHSLHDPARFRAWASRIVANKSRDWVRREQARRGATRRAESEPSSAVAALPSAVLEALRAGLEELGPNQRAVLTWFYLEEMSVGEIAEVLDIPAGTVKSRLFHARSALRARLEES